jgi:hypothetical protein
VKRSKALIGAAAAVVAALGIAGPVAAVSTVVVRPGDVGASWVAGSRPGGSSAFVTGPATAPLGVGSLQFTTADVHASAELLNRAYIGTPLANFDAMSYAAYRSSGSTNPNTQAIALALEVDVNGPNTAGGFATLVFEPDYQAGGNAAMKTDTWQTWDAYQGGNAIWWATKDIPGAPVAFNTFVSWNTILAANPQATIAGGVGLFVGSGWDGQFTGYADALKIGVGESSTIYDFEPKTQLVVTAPDATKVAGDAVPSFGPTYSGFLYGDTAASLTTQPTCTTTATAGSPAGTYAVTCSGGASANYDITYVPGTLTVVAAGATAPTPEPTEQVGGATGVPVQVTPPPTSTGGGVVGGETAGLVALLICFVFGSLGLVTVASQRRRIRR